MDINFIPIGLAAAGVVSRAKAANEKDRSNNQPDERTDQEKECAVGGAEVVGGAGHPRPREETAVPPTGIDGTALSAAMAKPLREMV